MAAKKEENNVLRRTDRPLVVIEKNLGGIEVLEQAREWGWDLLDLALTHGSIAESRRPSGALLRGVATDSLVRQLREMGCPVVRCVNVSREEDSTIPTVLPDKVAAGRIAAAHFAERNFGQVAFVAGHRPIGDDFLPLYEEFCQEAERLGMTCHLMEKAHDHPGESGAHLFDRRAADFSAWISGMQRPLGLFTYSDRSAARLCLFCRRAGIVVPEEVAILGCNNDRLTCEMAPVALSSVDLNDRAVVLRGMHLLRRCMAGAPPPTKPIMVHPTGIVERHSTNVLAVTDPAVARALRFIWDSFPDPQLTINEIAANSGACRRTLERKFRTCLGRGINEELNRKRLEYTRRLLLTTELTTAKVAAKAGFPSGNRLHKVFVRTFGITPKQYRLLEKS